MGGNYNDPFSSHMEAVAKKVLGDPVSFKGGEMRYGSQGSLSIDVRRGVFRSFEDQEQQGGVLDLLVAFEDGVRDHADAVKWMRREGFPIPDRHDWEPNKPRQERKPAPKPKPASKAAAKAKPGNASNTKKGTIVGKGGEWFYGDEEGEILFRVTRWELDNGKKTFGQYGADGAGGFRKGEDAMKGVRLVPYHLHEVIEAIADGRDVYVVEGEKNVERMRDAGFCATTNPMGAGKWGGDTDEGRAMAAALNPHFRGGRVIIIPDNDEPGRKHAKLVARELRDVAESVHVLELPKLDPKEDVYDWLETKGGTAAELQELKAKAQTADDYLFEAPLKSYTFLEAVRRGVTRSVDLVEDLLSTASISLLYGASGTGKSFFASTIGFAVARGVDFMGKYTTPGLVLYQAGEGKEALIERMIAYAKEHDLDDDFPFVLITEEIDLLDTEGTDEEYGNKVGRFIATVKAYEERYGKSPALIAIDTLNTAAPTADENTSQDMGRIITAIKRIHIETGAHVMIVHHKNAVGDRSRGHGSLYAGVDNAIEVNSTFEDGKHSERHAIVVKLKSKPGGERIDFDLKSVEIGTDERSGKPITSCVVVPATQAAAPKADNGARLDADAKLARRVVTTAFERHTRALPSQVQNRLGQNAPREGVTYDDALNVFIDSTPSAERGDRKAMAKRFDRRLNKLLIAGVVHFESGWLIWK